MALMTKHFMMLIIQAATLFCSIHISVCQSDESIEVTFEVVEESRIGTEVGNIIEASRIRDFYPDVDFEDVQLVFDAEPRFPFNLDRLTGIVSVSGRLDREAWCANRAECLDRVNVYVFIEPTPGSYPTGKHIIPLFILYIQYHKYALWCGPRIESLPLIIIIIIFV